MTCRLSITILLTLASLSLAQASPLPESCTDSRGRAIAVEADYQQAVLVRTVNGQIRHNPRVLSHLPATVRLFFVAHACAQVGAATGVPPHRADCAAFRMLQASGQLSQDGAAGFARELVFTTDEWPLLPGPARTFDFSDCTTGGNILRLPLATPPSAAQADWNACAHACGDRLWHCGNNDACLGVYDTCLKSCGAPPAAVR